MRRSVPQGTGSGPTEGKGSRKATPAERIRGELMDAVGEASLNFSGYCRLAAQAMLQTAMEIEAAEFIGRVTYQRRGEDQSTYRNGYKRRKVATGEGPLELFVPQTRDGVEPFQTAILGAFQRRSELLDALIPANGICGGTCVRPRACCGAGRHMGLTPHAVTEVGGPAAARFGPAIDRHPCPAPGGGPAA